MLNKFLDKTKIVLYGVILIVIVFIFGAAYSYFSFDKLSVVKNPVLESKFFTILKTFKDENIDFANVYSLVSPVFSQLTDTRIDVKISESEGRVNPFAP